MKNSRYSVNKSSSESGVALVFALAMLALLLLLLIGFLSSALFEQRIAHNQSGQANSHLIARSALQQIKLSMASYSTSDAIVPFTAYGDEGDGSLTSADIRMVTPFCSLYNYTASGSINMSNGDNAFSKIQNLLRRKGINPDNYNWDKTVSLDGSNITNQPYWIPMTVHIPARNGASAHDHIIGRYAFAVLPNLGLDPYLFTRHGGSAPEAIGVRYNEMLLSGLGLTNNAWNQLQGNKRMLSLDMLTSRMILGNGAAQSPAVANSDDPAREDFNENSATTFAELVNTYFTTRQMVGENYDDSRTDLSAALTDAQAQTLAGKITNDEKLKKQIAANIVDYMDTDSTPTSNVAPANWRTTAPEYTGNEKTAYINQIVPMVTLKAEYTENLTKDTAAGTQTGTQDIKVTVTPDLLVELVNIYAEKVKGGKISLDKLNMTVTVEAKTVNGSIDGAKTKTETLEFNWDTVLETEASATDIDPRKYVTMRLSNAEKSAKELSKVFTVNIDNVNSTAPIDVEILAKLTKISFGNAIFTQIDGTNETNVDMAILDANFTASNLINPTISVTADPGDGNDLQMNDDAEPGDGGTGGTGTGDGGTGTGDGGTGGTGDGGTGDGGTGGTGGTGDGGTGGTGGTIRSYTWKFPQTGGSPDSTTVTAYASWEADDPRCNLDKSQWTESDKVESSKDGTIHNAGFRNGDVTAKNQDIVKARDLEPNADPAKLTAAYIRNAPMLSVWELGLIHRGQAWRTINLKSADDSREFTYWNDAVLLDEVYITSPEGGTAATDNKQKKFNINYPHLHQSAFGALVSNVKYHDTSEELLESSGELAAAAGTALTAVQQEDLRKWIAHKCYESKDNKYNMLDTGVKTYHFYKHRGYLANVIKDWILNANSSPYKGKDLMDGYLEELIGKIVPLTRADGDPYEYFTAFIVAQSIKDVGGLTSQIALSRYDRSGTLQTENCQQGRWENGFDKVTGEAYMIVRFRRVLNCSNSASCQDGKHSSNCTFNIEVIESYTMNEP